MRTQRHGENPLKMAATRLAYRLIQFGSSIELPVDAGDFKLLSRPAVDHLLRLRESDPYLRGLVVWLGFNQVCIPYERDSRHAGTHALPVLQQKSVEDVHDRPHVVFVHADLRLFRARGVRPRRRACCLALARARPFMACASTFFWATTIGAIAVVGTYLIRVYKDVQRPPAVHH